MEEQKGSWVAEEQLKKVEQVIEKEEESESPLYFGRR